MSLKKPTLCRDWRPFLGYVRWLALPPCPTEREAREAFEARYGRKPLRARRLKNLWLVGPVFSDDVPSVRCSFD